MLRASLQTHSFAARQLGRLAAGASDRLSESGRTAATHAGTDGGVAVSHCAWSHTFQPRVLTFKRVAQRMHVQRCQWQWQCSAVQSSYDCLPTAPQATRPACCT